MLFKAWKKLDQQGVAIKNLWVFVGVLIVLNLFLLISLAAAPKQLRVYVPPDLSRGAMLKPGNIPKATVYAFAFQIFTALNSWPDSGMKEYGKNINSYRNYLSPAFYQQLEQDKLDRSSNGELSRKRIMSGVSGMGYQPIDVTILGNGTWLVKMQLQIMETLEGAVIKNVIMTYPLIISRVHTSIQINPWGLEIRGYNQHPYRVKTIV